MMNTSKLSDDELRAKIEERIKIGEEVERILKQDEKTNLSKLARKLGVSRNYLDRAKWNIEANKEMLRVFCGE